MIAVNIDFDEKAISLVQEKSISSFLIDVDLMEEPCVQVLSPVIKLKFSDNDEFAHKTNVNGIEILISNQFIERFGKYEKILISIKGLIRKQLFIKNIEPIIKNVCII
ncbi:hypothetical protein DSAG12_03355 [Promethearchaeum syntrophicum]|uniref:Uncharacterized protein n=1 Tax=Promethearchaeum syntrophicum TaxID=2594042 RepID=A0A5B9DE41_9ARCH|nr:hypothetical protein [Candidatus Prometheoarchaeum syntrophicum]QEE17518.1 hypothetical protein DSAG12_03355 [Candidatus Prometheoarchaeum syntrophicum]